MTLNADEKVALLRRYSDRLAKHGPTLAALGWTKPKHTLRYQVLLDYWFAETDGRPLRILDFGCGFGDLYGYAAKHKLPVDYVGVDINPDLVQVARDRYPSATFLNADLFAEVLEEKYDVVVSSGVHNFFLADNSLFNSESFALFDHLSCVGFAVNFMSNRVDFRSPDVYYAAPEDILSLALQYSRRIRLRHDYMPFEFTVFIDKREDVEKELLVFQDFARYCEF
jgi:SAM-dependent methyltransferase